MANKPLASGYGAVRTRDQLWEHYQIEKELAGRLKQASQAERRSLYRVVYDERLRRIPAHPLLQQAQDAAARERAMAPQLRLILSFLPANGVLLEIGPGDCSVALAAARYARHVLAVDVSDGLIQPGKRPDNFEFCFSDGLSVPAPAGEVDLAYSSQVMEHLHPDDAFEQLRNIYDALAPGGAYLCITPNRLSGPWDISRGMDDVASGLHLKEYTIGELGRLFRVAGFRRVVVFVSVGGRILSPRMPVGVIAAVERGLERLPPGLRRRLALGLTAVKIIGYK